eukprot:655844-Pelagomonas_calceolata.AAC.4
MIKLSLQSDIPAKFQAQIVAQALPKSSQKHKTRMSSRASVQRASSMAVILENMVGQTMWPAKKLSSCQIKCSSSARIGHSWFSKMSHITNEKLTRSYGWCSEQRKPDGHALYRSYLKIAYSRTVQIDIPIAVYSFNCSTIEILMGMHFAVKSSSSRFIEHNKAKWRQLCSPGREQSHGTGKCLTLQGAKPWQRQMAGVAAGAQAGEAHSTHA